MTTIRTIRRPLAHASAPARLALDADEFEGYASLFGVPDGAGDVVAPGAFAASLRKRPPAEVRMLYQHSALEPLGVWQTIREDGRGLYVRGRLVLDVRRAREVRALIRDGALNGLSIGFRTRRAVRDAKTGLRRLTEIELWEISIVTFPLLAGSAVTALGGKGTALAATITQATNQLRQQNNLSSRPSDCESNCASRDPP
ncbi:MAG: HK97 family phage prohead protease [Alphaproteobacteria bacterium]|nr:HK97 family phage prohead protease [Alphaproteobacteria bacterium]